MTRTTDEVSASLRIRTLCGVLMLCGMLCPCVPAHAGPQIALMAGYGVSFFDDDFMRFLGTTSHGTEVPIGLIGTVPVLGALSVGLELRLSLLPFRWDYRLSNESVGEATVSQNAVLASARYDLARGPFLPYLKAGVGIYGGSAGLRGDPALYQDESISFRQTVGFSAGAGLQGPIGPDKFWFGELVMHALRRTLDVTGYTGWRATNCAIQLGAGRLF